MQSRFFCCALECVHTVRILILYVAAQVTQVVPSGPHDGSGRIASYRHLAKARAQLSLAHPVLPLPRFARFLELGDGEQTQEFLPLQALGSYICRRSPRSVTCSKIHLLRFLGLAKWAAF